LQLSSEEAEFVSVTSSMIYALQFLNIFPL